MRGSLIASIAFHVVGITMGTLALSRPPMPMESPMIIPVDIIAVRPNINIAPSKPIPVPDPVEPIRSASDIPESETVDDIASEVVPDPDIMSEPEPEPEPEPELLPPLSETETPPVEPAPEPQDSFDDFLGDTSALLRQKQRDTPSKRRQVASLPEISDPKSGLQPSTRNINTAPLIAILRAQTKICWAFDEGWANPERLAVTLGFNLGLDGYIIGKPKLIKPKRMPGNDPAMRAAIDAAYRALDQCQPFKLPQDSHEDGAYFAFNFDQSLRS